MIEVKATKPAKAEEDAHDRYVLKNDGKQSKVPMFLTLFLTGFALYLKTALSHQQEAPPAGSEQPQSPADGEEALPAADTVTALATIRMEEEEGEAPQKKAGAATLSNYKNAVSYALTDSPTIEFNRLNLPSVALLKTSGGISVSFHASNDNAWTAPRTSAPRSHSSGDGAPAAAPVPGNEKTPNRAPRIGAPVIFADVSGCAIALIGLAELLRGTLDPDGDVLSVRDIAVSTGKLVQTAGGWTYDAAALGPVTLTYQISDGTATVLQTAHFSVVRAAPITGTGGDDLLAGTQCADEIDGLAGNDNIDAREGNDTVSGGDGDDNIVGGSGNDTICAGNGNDVVLGGLGDDHIWGGGGNDRLYGEEGRDTLFGESGNDLLAGGTDSDMLYGGGDHDTLSGDAGNDILDGEDGDDGLDGGDGDDVLLGRAGTDTLAGGTGNDFLSGGDGRDTVKGDAGNDTVAGDADRADDSYDGGSGIDTLDYSALAEAVEIDLIGGTASGTEIGDDAVSNFEIVRAGASDDLVTGSTEAEEIHGNDGDDRLGGGEGADIVRGGDGDDTVIGDGDREADNYDGGDGIDTLDYSAAVMSIAVDLAARTATGEETGSDSISNFEVIKTGAGDDVVSDGDGADAVFAGDGDDIVVAATGSSDDEYRGEDGFDTIDYSQAAHAVLIDLNTGTATGFDVGHDVIEGFEKMVCGTGDDIVRAGPVAVVIEGGDGEDTFEFSVPAGGSSADVVHQILDFMVGDRIDISKYKIFEEVIDGIEERFEDIYGDKADAEPLPIRVRHEGTDDMSRTFIEVDMDKDQHYEMTINLTGHHLLVIVENPAA